MFDPSLCGPRMPNRRLSPDPYPKPEKSLNKITKPRDATALSASVPQGGNPHTDASPVIFSSFPQELIDEILSHIEKKDVHRLSLCSKHWRSRTLPTIFHRISWKGINDANLFSDGGILEYVRPVVRQVSMRFARPPEDLISTIETYRIWMEIFSLLPNVKKLQVDLHVINELESNMIRAILTKISTNPAFETLHTLNIERLLIGRGNIHDLPRPHRSNFISTFGIYDGLLLGIREYYEILSPKLLEFLGPLDNKLETPLPKGLTKLGVSLKQFRLESSPDGPLDFNTLVHSLSGNLKELRIMADKFVYTSRPTLAKDIWSKFSSLTKLTMIIDGYYLNYLTDIGDWLPNIRFLALSNGPPDPYRGRDPNVLALLSVQEQILAKAIGKLKALEKIRLTCPYTYEDNHSFGIHSLNHWRKVYFDLERLEGLVGQWVKAGSSNLERVIFAKEYFPSNGRNDEMLIVNVRRGLEFEGGWELDSHQRKEYTLKPYHRDFSV
ncbi:hypothetical protein TWF718_010417 [Orbilia javanica]|uniref:F-box domain-containing protein n=1 Tax=Orbilia javanica TaxID=47235 RepID=A0AAN8RE56_9PEZI